MTAGDTYRPTEQPSARKIDDIKAPIKKGDVVGKINVIENNKTIMTIDATVDKNIDKANIAKVYLKNLLDIVKGTF